MTLDELKAAFTAGVAQVESTISSVLGAHPEIETDLANAATDAVASLKTVAQSEVATAPLPPEVISAIDASIAAAQAEADAQIQSVKDALATKVASLTAAKGTAA
jgi:hypothetical protein